MPYEIKTPVKFSELSEKAWFSFVQGGQTYVKRQGGWAPTNYNGPAIPIEGGNDPLVFPY